MICNFFSSSQFYHTNYKEINMLYQIITSCIAFSPHGQFQPCVFYCQSSGVAARPECCNRAA